MKLVVNLGIGDIGIIELISKTISLLDIVLYRIRL